MLFSILLVIVPQKLPAMGNAFHLHIFHYSSENEWVHGQCKCPTWEKRFKFCSVLLLKVSKVQPALTATPTSQSTLGAKKFCEIISYFRNVKENESNLLPGLSIIPKVFLAVSQT